MMDYFSILFHRKNGESVPIDGKFYEALFAVAGEWEETTIVGVPPIIFLAKGDPLSDYLISGNTVQNGTPTPEAPVDVVGCGEWDSTEQQYKIPITCGGVTTPIYLGNVPTTRRVKKLVLTGDEEGWYLERINSFGIANFALPNALDSLQPFTQSAFNWVCSHFEPQGTLISQTETEGLLLNIAKTAFIRISSTRTSTKGAFKSYLAAQYANGTPVTVWYVLATPETGIVNEPLMKIGDYADTVSMAQAGVTIPTVAGTNTLTVDTTVQPSVVSITGNIKEVQGT